MVQATELLHQRIEFLAVRPVFVADVFVVRRPSQVNKPLP